MEYEEKQKVQIGSGHKKRNLIIFLLVVCDIVSVFIALTLAVWIRFERFDILNILLPWAILSVLFCLLFLGFRLYHSMWRYSGISEALRIITAMAIGAGLCFLCNAIFGFGISRSVLTLFPLLLGVLMCASRFGYRAFRYISVRRNKDKHVRAGLLIVGAGSRASIAIAQMRGTNRYRDIVAVDDDPNKLRMRIQGVEVIGCVEDIPKIVTQRSISDIVVAIPSLEGSNLSKILDICKETGCRVRMLPLERDTNFEKEKSFPAAREVQLSDILFRSEVQLDLDSICAYLNGKNVLVTGGGGSIGSEICRQVARFDINTLTIFDIYENTAYELYCELKRQYGEALNIKVLIGSVREKKRLEQVFEEVQPQIVFHAAAHKHVPLMEDCPLEAIKNNVAGTVNVLEAASKYGVERFVNLSTDKAVNPTNIMGATKRLTELTVQAYSRDSVMKCMSVRFGNVLGSHGSVVPLMEGQIKSGGPVTITHPDIIRYFMTIPEASQLVLQAGALANSGSIYVLDMGNPVKIMDLAEKLIRFYGYEPNVDIPIEITGLRPGEKLYEELAMEEEKGRLSLTEHKRIFKLAPGEACLNLDTFKTMLQMALDNDLEAIGLLKEIVTNYQPWCDRVQEKATNNRESKLIS